jgi:hypothetical protein
MSIGQTARRYDQTPIGGASELGDSTLDFPGVADIDRGYIHFHRWRHVLDYGELADPFGYGRIAQYRRSRYARRYFFEQLKPFCDRPIFDLAKSSGVAVRPR